MGRNEKRHFPTFFTEARRLAFPFLLALLLSSCSRTPYSSGQYILLEEGDTVESIAREFGITQESVKLANRHKDFLPGEWVFVPMANRGLIPHIRGEDNPAFGENMGQVAEGSGQFLWPVPASGRVSSLYGQRGEKFHHGIDIPAPSGSTFVAAEGGRVIHSGRKLKGFGNLTIISHGGDMYTIYAHAQKNYTKVGEMIEKGQVIGEVGSTGKSTGPHLHFEVRRRKQSIDPMEFLHHGAIGLAN